MSTRHLIDPELIALLDAFPATDLTAEQLPTMRARQAQAALMAEIAPGVEVGEVHSAPYETSPGARMRTYRPKGRLDRLPVYLHIHGGGYVSGSPEGSGTRNSQLATELGCFVASVDYRLAPEWPYPNALHDCYSALLWLAREASVLGLDPTRIAVGGESAGAGLAAALCLLARDDGRVAPIFQALTFPMLDDRTCVRTDISRHVGEFVWTAASNCFGWSAYLGGKAPGSGDVEPYAAAARVNNLTGSPATFIATGSLDLFVEENIDYARRLMRAGVPTEVHVYPGAFHAFNLSNAASVTLRYRRDLTSAIERAFVK